VAALVGFFGLGLAGIFETIGSGTEPDGAGLAAFLGLIFVVGIVAGVILIRMSFAPILMADKGLALGDALKLSWKASGMRIWTLIGAMIVLSIMAMTGMIALFVGVLLTMAFPYVGHVGGL
jgi:hypothetical protein